MRSKFFAVAMLAVVPALAQAQKGGAVARDSAGTALRKASFPKVKLAAPGEFDDMNIAKVLVDKRKKLNLTDDVVALLAPIQQKIHEGNAPSLTAYDAARDKYRELTGNPDFERSADAVEQSQKLMAECITPLNAIRDQRKTDAAAVLAVIPDAQKAAVAALIKDQDSDFGKMIPRSGGR